MDTHAEQIWQRGSARGVMREARKRFRVAANKHNLVTAYVALASDHYSLVKRYMKWWQLPLAMWHLWRAARNVNTASYLTAGNWWNLSADQIDIMTTIWRKAPRLFGGNRSRAEAAIRFAIGPLHREAAWMLPHTRALLFISLGEIEWRKGAIAQAMGWYASAQLLASEIEQEDSLDRERQLIRVLSAIGFFYCDYPFVEMRDEGIKLLQRAYGLACRVSRDQAEKILAGCRKRGLGLLCIEG